MSRNARKPSAAARTASLFEGISPVPSPVVAVEKVRREGFEESYQQPSLFGAKQTDLTDYARHARDAARRTQTEGQSMSQRSEIEKIRDEASRAGDLEMKNIASGALAGDRDDLARVKPMISKKRKRSGGPTAASLGRQEERLKRARAAEAEARAQTEKAEENERKTKANEKAVEDAIKTIKTLRADVKTFKAHAKRHHAKAKVERAKAAKLAKG